MGRNFLLPALDNLTLFITEELWKIPQKILFVMVVISKKALESCKNFHCHVPRFSTRNKDGLEQQNMSLRISKKIPKSEGPWTVTKY